jgi:hypothetical protein
MVSATVAHLPTAVSLLLLEALFMQISGVSLTLTWPCRLCLFRLLLCACLCYKLSLSKHTGGGDTAPAFSDRGVCLQLTWEVGLPPLLWSFPPSATLTSFPAPGCWACAPPPLPPDPLQPGPDCLFTVLGRIPLPRLRRSVHPTLFPVCLYCSYCFITQFLFFPQVGVSLSRGLC